MGINTVVGATSKTTTEKAEAQPPTKSTLNAKNFIKDTNASSWTPKRRVTPDVSHGTNHTNPDPDSVSSLTIQITTTTQTPSENHVPEPTEETTSPRGPVLSKTSLSCKCSKSS